MGIPAVGALVRFALRALRAVAEGVFFLEAQRVLLRLVRPTGARVLARIEARLLSGVAVRHVWVRAGAHRLHTLVAGEGDAVMVLLHGHSMSAAFWYRNIDDMVALGYRVYAVDLLGWGRSDRPQFVGACVDDTLRWYLESFAAWVATLGLHDFTLVGHSLGAYLAMEYAKLAPESVSRLVLISPAAITSKISLNRALYFALPPQALVRRGGLLGFLLFMLKYPRDTMYVRDRLREYTYHLATQCPPSGEVAVRPIIKIDGRRAMCTRPLLDSLQLLRIPVQLVCGVTDSSINVEDVHVLFREMKHKGFRVKLAVIDGTDHCPHLEAPEEFFKVMADMGNPRKRIVAADAVRGTGAGTDAAGADSPYLVCRAAVQ